MLKSVQHIDILEIDSNKSIFQYRQKHGSYVTRRFRENDKIACIFEATRNFDDRELSNMCDILKMDNDWRIQIEYGCKVNFKLEENKIIDIINVHNSRYRLGLMLIFNDNFKESHVKKFWLMCDIYVDNILNNKDLKYRNQKEDEFKRLYEIHIKKINKRPAESDLNTELKRVRNDTYSYRPPEKPQEQLTVSPQIGMAQYHDYSTFTVPSMEIPNPTVQTILESIEKDTPIDPRLRGDSLNSSYGSISQDIPSDPRVRKTSSDETISGNISRDPRLRKTSSDETITGNISRDPRLRKTSLNSSYGSNYSMMSQLSEASMPFMGSMPSMTSVGSMPQDPRIGIMMPQFNNDPVPQNNDYEILKKKYDELKAQNIKYYRDATHFKKKALENEKKAVNLDGQYRNLKKLFNESQMKNEFLITKLNTQVNRSV